MDETRQVIVTKEGKTSEQWTQALTDAVRQVEERLPNGGHLVIMVPMDDQNETVRVLPISERVSWVFEELNSGRSRQRDL